MESRSLSLLLVRDEDEADDVIVDLKGSLLPLEGGLETAPEEEFDAVVEEAPPKDLLSTFEDALVNNLKPEPHVP